MEKTDYKSKRKEEDIGPTYDDVLRYSLTNAGTIDLRKMLELEGRFGGRCDVRLGPCACGAWHLNSEPEES